MSGLRCGTRNPYAPLVTGDSLNDYYPRQVYTSAPFPIYGTLNDAISPGAGIHGYNEGRNYPYGPFHPLFYGTYYVGDPWATRQWAAKTGVQRIRRTFGYPRFRYGGWGTLIDLPSQVGNK